MRKKTIFQNLNKMSVGFAQRMKTYSEVNYFPFLWVQLGKLMMGNFQHAYAFTLLIYK